MHIWRMTMHHRSIIPRSRSAQHLFIRGKTATTSKNPGDFFDYPKFCNAVSIFNKLYGNPWISKHYKVPIDDEEWPLEYRGYDLGSTLLVYRSLMRYPSMKYSYSKLPETSILREVNFIENPTKTSRILLLESVKAYKAIYQRQKLPILFEVPKTKIIAMKLKPNILPSQLVLNIFPRTMWGTKLGKLVMNSRARKLPKNSVNRTEYHKTICEEIDAILNS